MNHHHPATMVGLAFACIAVVPGALAQTTAATPPGHGHGATMSAQQHATGAATMFKRMDADADGYVTAAEMDALRPTMMRAGQGTAGMPMAAGMPMGPGTMMGPGMMMGTIDSDRDGSVSAQEHAAAAKANFDRHDTDRNGRITAAEWSAAHQAMPHGGAGMPHGQGMAGTGAHGGMAGAGMAHGPGMAGAGMRHGQGMAGGGMPGMEMGAGMGPGMGMSSAQWLRRMDRDGDGRVSATEHAAGTADLFQEADTDKDGKLSAAEMAAHRALMLKRGPDTSGERDDGGRR